MPPHSRWIPGGIHVISIWIPSIPYGIYLAEGPAILAYASMFILYGNSMEFEYSMNPGGMNMESITISFMDSIDSILFQMDSTLFHMDST